MIRSGYSFRTAFGHLEEVFERTKECGLPAMPLADRNSTFGHVKWNKLCKKNNLKPVFGVEIGVTAQLGAKKPILDYWTFLAINELRDLHELIAIATTNPGKEPSLTYQQAMNAKGLIKIAGEKVQLDQIKPADDLFIGLSPAMSKGLFNSVDRAPDAFQIIAKSDNVYPRAADLETYRVALGWRSGTQTYPRHILTDDEWRAACQYNATPMHREIALRNRNFILANCNAQLKQAELLRPERKATLREMCLEGAAKVGCNLNDKVYADRLDRELTLIAEKNFEDYFYIIADIIAYAKQHMIVGPARGSSCGSLVCYLLGITTIDPIPYNLIFERFIDINRRDLPDIDIDFSDARRDLVFEYAEKKYGSDRVARLGTVGLFKPRSALKQVGVSLQIPIWMVEKTLEGVIEHDAGDDRALKCLEDTLALTDMGKRLVAAYPSAKIAGRMEGHPNNASQHAAGIVITQQPLIEYAAVDQRTSSIMCDKKDAEDLNLLKIDALGLTQLSIFERTLQLIGKPAVNGYLETLPLDDPLAFEVLNKKKYSGIFQFAGGALKSLTQQVKVETLNDLVSLTALARPGPLAAGGAALWVKSRTGSEKPSFLHEMMEDLTRDTYGVVVFQEQVMQIGRKVGLMSWEEVSELRKIMGKTQGGEAFGKFEEKFLSGAVSQGVEPYVAKQIWEQICNFGSYGFNRSHAVAYAHVSYWCCWLKAHHPIEFAAATLDAEKDPMKQIALLRELKAEGIHYVAIDPDYSTDRWAFKTEGESQVLVGPLTMIKGIGPKKLLEILDARATGKELRASLAKQLAGAQTDIDTLYPIESARKKVCPDLEARNLKTTPTPISDITKGMSGLIASIGVLKTVKKKDENEESAVAKRGWKYQGEKTMTLNFFLQDDTGEVFCKIPPHLFDAYSTQILSHEKVDKAIYAIVGRTPENFRMIDVTDIKYLGDRE